MYGVQVSLCHRWNSRTIREIREWNLRTQIIEISWRHILMNYRVIHGINCPKWAVDKNWLVYRPFAPKEHRCFIIHELACMCERSTTSYDRKFSSFIKNFPVVHSVLDGGKIFQPPHRPLLRDLPDPRNPAVLHLPHRVRLRSFLSSHIRRARRESLQTKRGRRKTPAPAHLFTSNLSTTLDDPPLSQSSGARPPYSPRRASPAPCQSSAAECAS